MEKPKYFIQCLWCKDNLILLPSFQMFFLMVVTVIHKMVSSKPPLTTLISFNVGFSLIFIQHCSTRYMIWKLNKHSIKYFIKTKFHLYHLANSYCYCDSCSIFFQLLNFYAIRSTCFFNFAQGKNIFLSLFWHGKLFQQIW